MFFITCLHQEDNTNSFNGSGYDFTAQRTFGFKETFEDADKSLKNNSCDMFEYLYETACIEELDAGIHPNVKNIWWYKYDFDKMGFYPIKEAPPAANHLCNFSIG